MALEADDSMHLLKTFEKIRLTFPLHATQHCRTY
jgi:hypothetical protein